MEREGVSKTEDAEDRKDIEAHHETVCVYYVVSSPWIIVAWCVGAKRIPQVHCKDLELEDEKEEQGQRCLYQDRVELVLSSIVIGVDIEDEDNVQDREILRKVLDCGSRPHKEERDELEQVDVEEVHIIDAFSYHRWKD